MFSREDYRSWKLGKCGWKLWINHFFFLTYFSSTRCLMFDGILFESLKGACIILQKSCKSFLLFCCCSFVINNGRLPACFCSLSAPLLLSSVVWEVPTKWGSLQMAALGSKHQGHFTVYFKTRWSHVSHPFAATPPPGAGVHTRSRGGNVRRLGYDKNSRNFKVQLTSNEVKKSLVILWWKSRRQGFAFLSLLRLMCIETVTSPTAAQQRMMGKWWQKAVLLYLAWTACVVMPTVVYMIHI